MKTKNKIHALLQKPETKLTLVKIAREAKKERQNRLAWNM